MVNVPWDHEKDEPMGMSSSKSAETRIVSRSDGSLRSALEKLLSDTSSESRGNGGTDDWKARLRAVLEQNPARDDDDGLRLGHSIGVTSVAPVADDPNVRPDLDDGDGLLEAAHGHAVSLEQCSLFAEDVGDAIAKSMRDAAAFLRQMGRSSDGDDVDAMVMEAATLAFKARSFATWLRSERGEGARAEPADYDELAAMIRNLSNLLEKEKRRRRKSSNLRFPSEFDMADGRSYRREASGCWTMTASDGGVATGEDDGELADRYGLDALFQAGLGKATRT